MSRRVSGGRHPDMTFAESPSPGMAAIRPTHLNSGQAADTLHPDFDFNSDFSEVTGVLSAIYTYGAAAHAGGTISLTRDRQSIALAAEDNRRKRAVLERYQGCYVIVADHDRVVTTARSRRRFRR